MDPSECKAVRRETERQRDRERQKERERERDRDTETQETTPRTRAFDRTIENQNIIEF